MAIIHQLQQILFCIIILAAICNARKVYKSGKRLVRASSEDRVPDSYFIHIKKTVSMDEVHTLVQHLQRRSSKEDNFRASISGIITMAGYGLSATLSPEALKYMLHHNAVDFIEEDRRVVAGSTPNHSNRHYSWGLDRLDQLSRRYDHSFNTPCNLTGEGVDVYIMDTGIHFSHEQFEGRALYPRCDPADLHSAQQISQRLRNRPENQTGWDCVGHGTHVAGIAGGRDYGVAPGVNLYSIRVLSCDLIGSWNSIVEGIECILAHAKNSSRPAIVNMSLFGNKTRIVKRSISELLKHNITVVAIAGNSQHRPRDACRVSPASVRGVITVGASTRRDRTWYLSNGGLCVDIFAPGENILSANRNCNTCTEYKTGTSMAAPYVTGAVALLLQRCPKMPTWKVKLYLRHHMATKNKLNMRNMPAKMKHTTPNLLLNIHHRICSVEC